MARQAFLFALIVIVFLLMFKVAHADDSDYERKVFQDWIAVYKETLYPRIVNVDFGGISPLGVARDAGRLKHLVLTGPQCFDPAFRMAQHFESVKFIALDSTDVTNSAIDEFLQKRPAVEVYRSQRTAISQLSALNEKSDGPLLKTRQNDDYPEMRKLFGDEVFTELVAIQPSFVPGEEISHWPAFLNEDLKPLKYCPTLEVADLTWCRIDDAGAQYLKHLPNLRELHVIAEELSDDGIADLAAIPKLKLLRLNFKEAGYYHSPERTKERFKRLKKAHPHVRIESFDVN